MFTSRSAIETYQRCPRRRFWEYLYLGKGIRPSDTSVPLTTGTAVHAGVGHLLNFLRIGAILNEERIKEACKIATDKYEAICSEKFKGVESNYGNEYTFKEQKALTEGLVILWALVEAPELSKHYEVVEVEKEEKFVLVPGKSLEIDTIVMEGRVDAILKNKEGKNSYTLYNLKTSKRWTTYNRDSFAYDLQGLTESICVKKRWEREDEIKNNLLNCVEGAGLKKNHADAIEKCISGYGVRNLVGVRYCILVKGDYKEPWESAGFKCTHSPIVRGYKRDNPNGTDYAHSWYFDNPNNKSGKGALGRGWDPFNVWEKFEIADWVSACWEGEVQPEAKRNLLDIVQLFEVYRNPREIEDTLVQIQHQERQVIKVAKLANEIDINTEGTEGRSKWEEMEMDAYLAKYFPMNRGSCIYPYACNFIPICHKGIKPTIDEGWEFREPHHEGERESQ